MSKYSIDIGNFTMVPDSLVQKFGFLTAGVYGKIWRYEQMESGVCMAAQTTMAEELGIGGETLRIHIQKLIDGGYIEDLTPELRNRPHIYKTTNTLKLSISVAENPLPNADSRGKSATQSRKIRDESDSLRDIKDDKENIFKLWEQVIGQFPPPLVIEDLKAAQSEYPFDWLKDAFKIAVENNSRNWRYISTILKNWQAKGRDWQPAGKRNAPAAIPSRPTPPPPEVPSGTKPPPEFYAMRDRIHQAAKAEKENYYAVS